MTINASDSTLQSLQTTLLNTSGTTPLHTRFRALFTLKAVGDDKAVNIIGQGFKDPSALLKHELAYVLGQMSNPSAIPILSSVLSNESEDPMVRHEAAEALGALSFESSKPLLQKYASPKEKEHVVRETCEIALAKIEWDRSPEGIKHAEETYSKTFTSIDPAPPLGPESYSPLVQSKSPTSVQSVESLQQILLDTSLPLFTRYRAMFALRNIGTPEAIDALCTGFRDDSSLFKHEIAFILGQLSSPHSIPSLRQILHSPNEAPMVRHEAAEALGGITVDGEEGKKVLDDLNGFVGRKDVPDAVRESCEVALDMWKYENSNEFQYADGLD